MRTFQFFILLILISFLASCGSEELMTSPVFSDIMVNGSPATTESLLIPFSDPGVTISGKIDDVTANLMANTVLTGEVSVDVNRSDGSWSYDFSSLTEGANAIVFTASDKRGNINQLLLTVWYDTTPPVVTSVIQDKTDPLDLKLIITFNEALKESSVSADFAVNGTLITGATLEPLEKKIVTLPLSTELTTDTYSFTCGGVSDLSTPLSNVVAADYTFDFTID